VNQPVETVAALQNDGTITVAQLHGQEDEDYIAALRAATGGKPVWKAFKIRSEADLAAANASSADMVILDNGYGTGQTFDWSLAGGITRPFFLAGGLTPENIPAAIAQLDPTGLDLSSGVETDKKKDPEKMLAAVRAARASQP
jgi:phosphoribosylanthranilate isomerase